MTIKDTTAPYGTVALRELIDLGMPHPTGSAGFFDAAIQRSVTTLEVLVLYSKTPNRALNLAQIMETPLAFASHTSGLPFARLTHLELIVDITQASLDLMGRLLPKFSLVHLGVGENTFVLLDKVNLGCLRSLRVHSVEECFLLSFYCRVLSSLTPYQIQSLCFNAVAILHALGNILAYLPLRRLYLDNPKGDDMSEILPRLNLSQLQVLVINYNAFSSEMEAVLAKRGTEFTDTFKIQLGYEEKSKAGDMEALNPREV